MDVAAILPNTNAQKYLQAYYTAPFDDGDKAINFDDARDGSTWSAANARFNDYFREIVLRFQFEDALLLHTRGNVVYSAYKGADLYTNILTGPFREGELREAYQKAMASNAVDYVGVTYFAPTSPLTNPPRGCCRRLDRRARRRRSGPEFPISKINNLMTVGQQWQDAGMGTTGETFLIGPDGLMRSDSRPSSRTPNSSACRVQRGNPAGGGSGVDPRGGRTWCSRW